MPDAPAVTVPAAAVLPIPPEVTRLAGLVAIVLDVRAVLEADPDAYRRPPYLGDPNPMRGQCYVASEAVRALATERLGVTLTPCSIRLPDGTTHWWLRDPDLGDIDPTADQFPEGEEPDYAQGRGRGFLTRQPSARARRLLDAVRATAAHGEPAPEVTP